MSDTSDFAGNPQTFLANKVVMVPPETDEAVNATPGKYRFRIEPVCRNLYSLEKVGDDVSDAIEAHYLPWATLKATTMDLDESVSFFFTSEMTDCRFTVMADNPKAPKVAHIAGTLDKSKRNSAEEEVFGKAKRVRRLSISGSVGAGAHGYRGQTGGDDASSAFVFGQRDGDGWKFYAQVAKDVLSTKPRLLDDIRELSFVDILALKKTDKVSGKS